MTTMPVERVNPFLRKRIAIIAVALIGCLNPASRVREIVAMTLEESAWTQPICIEGTAHALLDGHHRLAAAIALGLARVPVYVFDYADVELLSWGAHISPTRQEVLARARSGQLYPNKTTRHVFPPRPACTVSLGDLGMPIEPRRAFIA
jgi:hypothetical protein